MSDEVIKKIMHVVRKAPHGTIYSYEGLEMVLIMAAYDQDICMCFMGDGVYSLIKDQVTDGIGIKGFMNTLGVLEDYDVERLYVDQTSLEERGLSAEDLYVDVEVLDSGAIGQLMSEQDVIVPH